MKTVSRLLFVLVVSLAVGASLLAQRSAPQQAAPAAGAKAVDASPATAKKIVDALQPYVDRGTLAGAVLMVARREKVLSVQAVGYADVAAKRPMRTDDLFWIASMTKPMTATALMMLVEEGKVHLDDPVGKYLPEFNTQMMVTAKDQNGKTVLQKAEREITVRDVLSHTSGLPYATAQEPRLDILSLREAVSSYVSTPLNYQPGKGWEYSNAGMNTAGRIIEVVSGMPYERFMQERLFTPLGMTDTTFWPSEAQVKRLAKCYHTTADKTALEEGPISLLTYPLTSTSRTPCPAGGLFSTASDVARFCRMILVGGTLDGRRYLSLAGVQEMTNSLKSPPSPVNGYALGWGYNGVDVKKSPNARCNPFGHNGACRTHMWIEPDRDLITVFMVQQQGDFPGADGNPEPAFQQAVGEVYGW